MYNQYLSKPFPNEHLLSVLARWFNHTGRNDFLVTAKLISNNVNALSPAAVWRKVYWDISRQFVDNLGWDAIVKQHTLVPYYAPFLTHQDRALLLTGDEELSQTRIKPAQQKLIKQAHNWRWCSECAEEDYENYGTPYWHTYHQLPTALTCYKHNSLLHSFCPKCNFSYQDFQKHWLPPINRKCPSCSKQIDHSSIYQSPLLHWLSSASYHLQENGLRIQNAALLKVMKEKIGYEALPSNISVSIRNELSQLQKEFQDWLPNDVVDHFYSKPEHHILASTNRVLKITSIVYREHSAPPLSILLILKFLGLEAATSELLT